MDFLITNNKLLGLTYFFIIFLIFLKRLIDINIKSSLVAQKVNIGLFQQLNYITASFFRFHSKERVSSNFLYFLLSCYIIFMGANFILVPSVNGALVLCCLPIFSILISRGRKLTLVTQVFFRTFILTFNVFYFLKLANLNIEMNETALVLIRFSYLAALLYLFLSVMNTMKQVVSVYHNSFLEIVNLILIILGYKLMVSLFAGGLSKLTLFGKGYLIELGFIILSVIAFSTFNRFIPAFQEEKSINHLVISLCGLSLYIYMRQM